MQSRQLKEPVEVYRTASYSSGLQVNRGDHGVNVVARLKPGASVAAARAAIGGVLIPARRGARGPRGGAPAGVRRRFTFC